MGFWGSGNFQNDHAIDWIAKFVHAKNQKDKLLQTINSTFNVISISDQNLIFESLAAIEIIAILNGNLPIDYKEIPEKNSSKIQHLELNSEIRERAEKAIDYIISRFRIWYSTDWKPDNISKAESLKIFEENEFLILVDLKVRISKSNISKILTTNLSVSLRLLWNKILVRH